MAASCLCRNVNGAVVCVVGGGEGGDVPVYPSEHVPGTSGLAGQRAQIDVSVAAKHGRVARRSFVQPSLSRVGRLFDGRDGEASSECLPVGANQTVCSCHICRAAPQAGCRNCSLALGYSVVSLVAVKSICVTHVTA